MTMTSRWRRDHRVPPLPPIPEGRSALHSLPHPHSSPRRSMGRTRALALLAASAGLLAPLGDGVPSVGSTIGRYYSAARVTAPSDDATADSAGLRGGMARGLGLLSTTSSRRRRKTPYVTIRDVVETMPRFRRTEEGRRGRDKPSHVELCEAYVARLGSDPTPPSVGPESLLDAVTVVESPDSCMDWTSPHESVMNMFASSLVSKVGSGLGLRYRHSCHATLPDAGDDGGGGEYDRTSTQQLLPSDLVSDNDGGGVDADAVRELCRACVAEFDESAADGHDGGGGTSAADHCLLMPEAGPAGGEDGGTAPPAPVPILAGVLPSVIDRLSRAAADHLSSLNVTAADSALLTEEAESGGIVFLDDTSAPMNYSVYDAYLPYPRVTRVQILASAACALSYEGGNSGCVDQGRLLKRYLSSRLDPDAVRLDVAASTAASFARMVNVGRLVCPPGTASCLLPALVRGDLTTSVLADGPGRPEARRWFDALRTSAASGALDNVVVVELREGEDDMPPAFAGGGRRQPPAAGARTEDAEARPEAAGGARPAGAAARPSTEEALRPEVEPPETAPERARGADRITVVAEDPAAGSVAEVRGNAEAREGGNPTASGRRGTEEARGAEAESVWPGSEVMAEPVRGMDQFTLAVDPSTGEVTEAESAEAIGAPEGSTPDAVRDGDAEDPTADGGGDDAAAAETAPAEAEEEEESPEEGGARRLFRFLAHK